jgi:very-short-patch-repair endonuclease
VLALDSAIYELAARQHGVVSSAQLVVLGATRNAIAHRVRTKRLVRLHRGVYRAGPIETPLTAPAAAVLACGPTAALSHHAAAALHGIRPPRPGPIDVTVRGSHRQNRKGIRVHRADVEAVRIKGIPTTAVTRTLLDIAAEIPQRELLRAIEEAQIQRKLHPPALADAVSKAAGHRGAAALRAAMQRAQEPRMTRSEAERGFLELIRAAQLPEPETNARLGKWEVDALWRRRRLVVEVDSFAFHSTREAFERDRRKDADLMDAGYRVQRITWRQLVDEREAVVARVARALSA